MALREELENQGNRLFRWRSYLPLLLIPLFILALPESTDPRYSFGCPMDQVYIITCIALSFLGLFFRALTLGFAPSGTSGGNTKQQKAYVLNTTGIYSIVRHPLYLGNFVIFLGIVLFVKVWWFAVIAVLLFWLYYERIMYREEEFLRNKFGEDFIAWAEKTPAFIPRFNNQQPANRRFSLKRVVYREYIGFFEIIACFTLLQIVKNFLETGRYIFTTGWVVFFSTGLAIFLMARITKMVRKISRNKTK
jgi:protein-S-isoprenylcysteine O-methyltransferase Ste14